MILLIDNYDSFTYNLVQRLGEIDSNLDVQTWRNDALSISQIRAMRPDRIILSPGPCTPNEAGICLDIIKELHTEFPILGVCLGHQSIGQALGGRVVRAGQVMHGKTSLVHHDNSGIFHGVDNPFIATRYHSLIVERETLPSVLTVRAWTEDGTIMGMDSVALGLYGVQFHPESIMTGEGKKIIRNFLELQPSKRL